VNENKRSTIISIGENYILSRKGESVKTLDKKKNGDIFHIIVRGDILLACRR